MPQQSQGLVDTALDWGCFIGVGAYLGGVLAYLRLTGQLEPPRGFPSLLRLGLIRRAASLLSPPRSGELEALRPDEGFAYVGSLPVFTTDDLGVSRLQVLEDGHPLGPAHASHDEIRRLGEGRFSHWGIARRPGPRRRATRLLNYGSTVLFSASDNSDPRTNGRSYTYRVELRHVD